MGGAGVDVSIAIAAPDGALPLSLDQNWLADAPGCSPWMVTGQFSVLALAELEPAKDWVPAEGMAAKLYLARAVTDLRATTLQQRATPQR